MQKRKICEGNLEDFERVEFPIIEKFGVIQ